MKHKTSKPLFICNTFYQIIVAIQLRLTLYSTVDADIVITDHTIGANYVAERLRSLGLFNSVWFICNKKTLNSRKPHLLIRRAVKALRVACAKPSAMPIGLHDELVCFNLDLLTFEIYDHLKAQGSALKLLRMEEGLSTCDTSNIIHDSNLNKTMTITVALRKLFHKAELFDLVEGFYCFLPELCDSDFPYVPYAIPSIDCNRDEFVSIIRKVFDYKGFPYSQKCIFFSSSLDIDRTPTGETGLVLAISDLIGRENLIVKMHPRDGRNIYQEAGISIMEGSNIPWEIVQLCEDLSDKVLLSCTSGSPLAITALLNDGVKAFFLKPENQTQEQRKNYDAKIRPIVSTVEKLHALGLCDNIQVLSIDELPRQIQSQD